MDRPKGWGILGEKMVEPRVLGEKGGRFRQGVVERGGGGTKGRPKGWKVSGTEEEKERGIGEGREKEE